MPPVTAILKTRKMRLGRALAALGVGLVIGIPAAAEAQYYYGRGYGYYGGPYYGAPYGGPYGPYGRPYYGPGPYDPEDADAGSGPYGETGPSAAPRRVPDSHPQSNAGNTASQSAETIPLEAIKQQIHDAGFKLVAPPRHKGNIYLAEVEDSKAVRHRLVYDAHDGHLIENTLLGVAKKPKTGQSDKALEPKDGQPADQAKAAPSSEPASHVNELSSSPNGASESK